MKLLITNDDGYDADGIRVLAEVLTEAGNDVWTIAPDRNRSAVSHGITWMREPLKFVKRGEKTYSCSGLPADCAIAGLRGDLIPFKPDAVISGINKGANIGTDILYSGTAAAARQASMYGVPGIALSVESRDDEWKYEALAKFAAANLPQLVSVAVPANSDGTKPDRDCCFANVNALSLDAYSGVAIADELVFREYHDSVHMLKAPDGNTYGFFCGGEIESTSGSESCDFTVCEKGFIAVSRVYAEPHTSRIMDDISFTL